MTQLVAAWEAELTPETIAKSLGSPGLTARFRTFDEQDGKATVRRGRFRISSGRDPRAGDRETERP